ncbi:MULTISPECIES: sensor histidine kinase [Pseudonocardia]|uniref:histidine kinase n=2 Tax=Pseudonocardia TaxID=1847 RepID=A0A1Y2MLE2_PSEAH|nr:MULTISPECIES: histidine kinase [Pseudonocardia]OSY35278.1 Nitrate/nitrite sensor protein NarX [Pseudonocardia autotrophica]TDN73283.1 signal transduction histidine kinase [Pseudonocardia autotrophica]BBG04019.1 two-component sensor histidine kinase [Pseudonocardia autotrophica]GEC27729.1 two-component sensor histidine kinase [Pseudonocardia saturnea]
MSERGTAIGAGVVLASASWLVVWLLLGARESLFAATALAPLVLVAGGLAGRFGDRRSAWFPALVPPAGALAVHATTGGVDTALAAGIGLGVLLWCPWLVGRWFRERAALGNAGWQFAAQWEELARTAEHEARMRERARLAADMHDLVGHDLARAALRLGALELDRDLPAEARRGVGEAREQVSAAAEHLAQAVSALGADRAPPTGAGADVTAVVAGVRAAGRAVELVPADPAPALDGTAPAVSALVVRVVREGLTNAVKHAGDAPAEVSIVRRDGEIDVVVRTRGARPGPSAPGSGSGLPGLSADTAALGGTLEHGRSGTDHLLAARLPVTARTGDSGLPAVETARRVALGAVRRSRSTAVRGIAAAFAVSVLLVSTYRVLDAATSVLPADTFDALTAGTERAAVEHVLPMRTRTDGTGIPRPPGAWCEYYSVGVDPFGTSAADLRRLCWAGGVLVHKDLIVRSATAPGTIGT